MAEKGTMVLDTAKVGCRYAQTNKDPDFWDVRRVRIDHNPGDEQHGCKVMHNHNCIKGEEREAIKFRYCYSPYYLTALESLKTLYPENEEYQNAYSIAYKRAHPKSEEDLKAPPCVLAVLDTWFEYSDVEISDRYNKLLDAISPIKVYYYDQVKRLRDWANKEIQDKREELKKGIPVSQPSNATKKQDTKELEQAMADAKEEARLFELKQKIAPLYKKRQSLIDEMEDYWEDILVFEQGYQSKLVELGNTVQKYIDDWTAIVKDAGLDLSNSNYTSFVDTLSVISENALSIGESMVNWETVTDNALMTSSFLICKCGGKIQFLSDGQQHYLYCVKILKKFTKLLKDTAGYLQGLLDNRCYYYGPEENIIYMNSAKTSFSNVADAFEETGKEFVLDHDTLAMELRFITRGYNKEKAKKQAALIGMMVLTPIAIEGSLAATFGSEGVGVAISAGLWIYDSINIVNQSEEELDENVKGDLTTIANDTTSVVSSIAAWDIKYLKHVNKTEKAVSALGNPTIVISFLNSLSGMFYTSEEDWIEDIEVTAFTKDLAIIAKERYDDQVEEVKPFDGKEMVIAKTKVDYSCDSLTRVNWDELEGVVMAVDKDFSFSHQKAESERVGNSNDIKEKIENKTNGELNE